MKNRKRTIVIPADKIVPAKVLSFFGIYQYKNGRHCWERNFVMIEHRFFMN